MSAPSFRPLTAEDPVVHPGSINEGCMRTDCRDGCGLIESTDSGENWTTISLLGKADFHVLRSVGSGCTATTSPAIDCLSAGTAEEAGGAEQAGTAHRSRRRASDPRRIVATSAGGLDEGLFESTDQGRSWKRRAETVGLLAWPRSNRLYLVRPRRPRLSQRRRRSTPSQRGRHRRSARCAARSGSRRALRGPPRRHRQTFERRRR